MTDVGSETHPQAHDNAPLGRVAGYCLAIMSFAAALIHFAVAAEHVQQYWLFGLSMLVVAWLQVAWAVVVIVRPSRPLLWAGALINAVVVAGYLITRTTGYAIGTAPREAGLSAFSAVFCAAFEAVVVAGCAWLPAGRAEHHVRRQRLIAVPAATAAMTAVVLGVALATAVPSAPGASAASASATGSGLAAGSGAGSMAGMRMPSAAAEAIRLPNDTKAGDIAIPDPNMEMMVGMRMASSTACTATPTAAEQRAAVSFVNASWAGAEKYQSLAVARAAGYRPITQVGGDVVHYLNPAYYRATLEGGPVLNTTDPQSLVYANTPRGAVLVAAMYIGSMNGPTPQPGGCLTQWHVHTNLCLTSALDVVGSVGPGQPGCPPGSVNRVTPAMIHVWYVPIPGGPTAIDASDQQVVQAAELVPAPPNGTA
jgi:hypothetical protein